MGGSYSRLLFLNLYNKYSAEIYKINNTANPTIVQRKIFSFVVDNSTIFANQLFQKCHAYQNRNVPNIKVSTDPIVPNPIIPNHNNIMGEPDFDELIPPQGGRMTGIGGNGMFARPFGQPRRG